jgi:hypothetical protein
MDNNIKYLIYRITCNKTGNIYYGSTKKTINQRLKQHESNYKRYTNGKYNYVTSFDILKEGDFKIELVEDLGNCTKEDLYKHEAFHIQNNECVNKFIPGRSAEEYYIDNREKKIASAKNWYNNNRAKQSAYKKLYYLKLKHKKLLLKLEKIENEVKELLESVQHIKQLFK